MVYNHLKTTLHTQLPFVPHKENRVRNYKNQSPNALRKIRGMVYKTLGHQEI